MDLSHFLWQRESKRQAVPLELSLQLVTPALPWCGGSCEAELGQLCCRWKLTGQDKTQRHPVHALLLVLPHTVSFPSPRNVKEMGREKTDTWEK